MDEKNEKTKLVFRLNFLDGIFETTTYAHLRNSRIKFITCRTGNVKYL